MNENSQPDRELLTPKEIADMLRELNVMPPRNGVSFAVIYDLDKTVEGAFLSERNKLTHNGLFHNSGNLKAFVGYAVKRFGSKHVSKIEFSDRTKLNVEHGNVRLELDVFEDHIKVQIALGEYLHIGLHSSFYDEILDFLFDSDGAFQKLFNKYHLLKHTLRHYEDKYRDLSKPSNFKSALVDESLYKEFKERYERFLAEIQPMSEFVSLSDWYVFFRNHALWPSIVEISSIQDKLTRKPEYAIKYQKKYAQAFEALSHARKYDLLTPEELASLIPWEEYIISISGGEADKHIATDSYISSVKKIFEQKLCDCEKSGTAYMQKKKARIEADREFCAKLKLSLGSDCFIDRSQFSASVDHFNVVGEGNMVWVFRIARVTPDMKLCKGYINIVKTLEELADKLGKKVTFRDAQRQKPLERFKIYETPFADKETIKSYSVALKGLKSGSLDINRNFVHLTLPVGGLFWRISLRRKDALETISSIVPLVKQFFALCNKCEYIAIKGIFHERLPNL